MKSPVLKARFADNLFYPEVKEAVGIIGLYYYGSVGTSTGRTGTGYGNNLLIGAYQSGIRCHNGYLTGYLHTLT
jgi:hypothetical protein